MHTEALISYVLRCLPTLVLGVTLLVMLPRNRLGLRLAVYVFLFVALRDAMTPSGLWRLGTEGWLWLRVLDDPALLAIIGLSCAGIVVAINRAEPELARLVVWKRHGLAVTVAAGLVGAAVVTLPVALLHLGVPIDARGGVVRTGLWPVLLAFCLLANFYEETLFRGYFQGLIEPDVGPVRAALLSGILFAFGHVFLATTVTDLGAPLLAFVLWEGMIAALVRMRFGVLASTVTHGTAIFLIASGIA